MPKIGSRIGDRYLVEKVLGEGGFATVYRCADSRTKTDVAIKVLDPMMSRRGEFAQRFLREIETVSRLRHHNTIKIFDSGETEQGCLYLVMELLSGEDLDEILEKSGPLEPARVKHITLQVLKSLMEAHQHQIMHRDLKPANVFIADVPGEVDYVKVLDFGIAKSRDDSADTSLTATGQVMCSPDYVAPERVRDHVCFFSSDLYSLGIMLIEMLEGELPYKGDTPIMVALQHARTEDAVPLKPYTQNGPLGPIIQKAVDKDPSRRYQTAQEMFADLSAADCDDVPAYSAQASHAAYAGAAGATTAYLPGGETVTDLQPVTDSFLIPESGPNSRLLIGIAAVVVAMIGGVVAILLISGGQTEPVATLNNLNPAPAAEDLIASAALTEPEPEPPVIHQPITLNTVPQGAEILIGDTSVGVTPFVASTRVVESYPTQLVLRLEGYEDLSFSVDSHEALLALPLAHTQRLVELPVVEEAAPTPTRSSRTSSSRSSSTASSAPAPARSAPEPEPSRSNAERASNPPPPTPAAEEPAPRRSRIGAVQVRMND